MRIYKYPSKESWNSLTKRPTINQKDLTQTVSRILDNVAANGDRALLEYTKKLDKVSLNTLQVSSNELAAAQKLVAPELKNAIQLAYANIYRFHKAQQQKELPVETSPGVKCWRKAVAIEKVGLYIPGGEAPLFSTVLMLGIPALLAGCKEIVLCTPPQEDGSINPAILYTTKLIGITKIYKVGGAQAIAAMGFGTSTITKVNKIFGPGNQYVTKAKEMIQQQGTAIDLPAGPSEVLVIAGQTADPSFIAADLLSQAEHGPDSQAILLSNNTTTINEVQKQLKSQLEKLPRKEIATKALLNSKAILLDNLTDCLNFSNLYAPEHLIIATSNPAATASGIVNAGSVFLGSYSCESAGDYASGTNHTLPTNGYAKNYSGVSTESFCKKITFQQISKQGLLNIGGAIELMAEAEQLQAHKNAVSIRLKKITNEQA